MYLTTTISVALVLCLIGLECVVVLSTRQLIRNLRENVAVSVVLHQSADSLQIDELGSILNSAPYTHACEFISKEEALQEHILQLGEDPTQFLGYNPLRPSFELHLIDQYAHNDSILHLRDALMTLPMVEEVMYQQDVVKILDANISELSYILAGIAFVLLVMAIVLINNTIRLHVYSKRFLINTMRLVGATPWVIKAPIVRRNVRMGFEAGVLALGMIALVMYYAKAKLGMWLFEINTQNIGILVSVVVMGGVLITFFGSLLSTSRYVRMKIDKMYEI